jgi:hypothetical protein
VEGKEPVRRSYSVSNTNQWRPKIAFALDTITTIIIWRLERNIRGTDAGSRASPA